MLRQTSHDRIRANQHRNAHQDRAPELSSCHRIRIRHFVAPKLKIDVNKFRALPAKNINHDGKRTPPNSPEHSFRQGRKFRGRFVARSAQKFQQLRYLRHHIHLITPAASVGRRTAPYARPCRKTPSPDSPSQMSSATPRFVTTTADSPEVARIFATHDESPAAPRATVPTLQNLLPRRARFRLPAWSPECSRRRGLASHAAHRAE